MNVWTRADRQARWARFNARLPASGLLPVVFSVVEQLLNGAAALNQFPTISDFTTSDIRFVWRGASRVWGIPGALAELVCLLIFSGLVKILKAGQ